MCAIEDCQKQPFNSRGWCQKHYARWRKHGDPLALVAFSDPEAAFIARTAWDGEHLIWVGMVNARGYGALRSEGRMTLAHRFSYEREHGKIPDGMYVDHKCWMPACVLPDHLRVATPAQNMWNRKGAQRNNASTGVRGVYPNRKGYAARVRQDGNVFHLGTYPTIEEAAAVVSAKRKELFGEFAGAA